MVYQRWSRRHKARGQGHKKIQGQGQTLSRPRTDPLEAKDTGASVLQKNGLQKFFIQVIYKILTIQKIVLSSSRGQDNFRGLEASTPRPWTSKCVLEDSTSVVYNALAKFDRLCQICYLIEFLSSVVVYQ